MGATPPAGGRGGETGGAPPRPHASGCNVLIDPTDSQNRDRRLGALIFGSSVALAALIVAARLMLGDGGDSEQGEPVPALPTAVFLTPAAPTSPPPTPTASPSPATPVPAPPTTAPTAPVAGLEDEGTLVGRVVCLDPGHGGSDLGNVRYENGEPVLLEKDFTLAHTLEIGRRLEERGATVVYTRTADAWVNPENQDVNNDGTVAAESGEAASTQLDELQARIEICNGAGAELLVSVHYNGAENEFLQGYEVWYNDERPFSDLNARLATIVHEELGRAYAEAGYDAFDKGIGTEEFVVIDDERPGALDPSQMPGVVVEGLFLTNEEDANFIRSPEAAETLVGAYERAIVRYLEETGR